MDLQYKLHSEPFVFCSMHESIFMEEDILLFFREPEGNTYVVTKENALAKKIPCKETWALITVETTTSLNAIGITAYISSILAQYNIPCNVVAAFHHDHLFVPFVQGSSALQILRE